MWNIDEARLQAGFFVHECLALFGISQRTWYRWREYGAPEWAFKLLKFQAGHLDQLGWKQWQIRNGILYFDGFVSHGYEWEPGELLAYHWTRHNTKDKDRGALPHTPLHPRVRGAGEKPPTPQTEDLLTRSP